MVSHYPPRPPLSPGYPLGAGERIKVRGSAEILHRLKGYKCHR